MGCLWYKRPNTSVWLMLPKNVAWMKFNDLSWPETHLESRNGGKKLDYKSGPTTKTTHNQLMKELHHENTNVLIIKPKMANLCSVIIQMFCNVVLNNF